jgi:hypothetical protein
MQAAGFAICRKFREHEGSFKGNLMTSSAINRAFLSAPILKSLLESAKSDDQIAAELNTSKSFIQMVVLGERDTTIDRYQQLAQLVGMELSLVPKHLARSAVLESGFNGSSNEPGISQGKWSKDLMLKLREHRLRNEASLDQVCEVLGNSMRSFVKFQNAEPTSSLPSVQVVQRYADMFNLVLVAVGQNSEFARHAKADFARDVTYKVPGPKGAKTRDNIDHVLVDLISKIKDKPEAFSQRYRNLADAAPQLSTLEPVELNKPTMVKMPPIFAAALKKRMLEAAAKGNERIPYAEVVKPWGDPKSWAKHSSKQTFDDFYSAVAALGLRHDNENIARLSERFLKEKPDLSMTKLLNFMQASGVVMTCDARLPNGERVSFAIDGPVELSLVVHKLIGDRPLSPILKATSLSKTSIESMIAHPEENLVSTVFRLFQHFDIKVGAQDAALVEKVELSAKAANVSQVLGR